ncbi:MAG TPA: T9SS type A sorting domain-containing protein, partial [Bacteroidales bacterium]|nr:T9SS type A sorting domain-containing protein [Bacteroidales bacterium]
MKNLCLLIGLMSTFAVHAQNHFIDFAGTGASSTVESVTVENLTQCASMTIYGADILNLAETVSIDENHFSAEPALNQYPNPAAENSNILYSAPAAGLVTITLINAEGSAIVSRQQQGSQGTHHFTINALPKGFYVKQ